MKLRTKLVLAQVPLLMALAATIVVALLATRRLGDEPDTIIEENFRSFDAGQEMLDALDRIDAELARSALTDAPPEPAKIAAAIEDFEAPLARQRANITEPGEDEATAGLEDAWQAYLAGLPDVSHGLTEEQLDAHLARSAELRRRVEVILALNRAGMRSKADTARQDALHETLVIALTGFAALLVALPLGLLLMRRVLRPIRIVAATAQRIGEGDFDARVRLTGNDELRGLADAFNDMTEHLAAYRASSLGDLLEANERLQSVVDSLPDAVIVHDLGGRVLQANSAARALLGEVERITTLPSELSGPVQRVFDRVIASSRPTEVASLADALPFTRGSDTVWLAIDAVPVLREGVLVGVTVALRDVSRARRLEGFRGDLVSAAAHELRTPLTSLHMAIHLCLEEAAGPLEERQKDLLSAARSDCERLQAVVDELLDMAGVEAGASQLELQPELVQSLLHEARARKEVAATREGLALEIVTLEAGLRVLVDRRRVAQILDNLIDNAVHHAHGARRVHLGAEARGELVRIWIEDDGPGIPEESRAMLFDKFVRGRDAATRGSGLGLSIVRDLVHAHGGEVGIEDASIGGARVWFTLPMASRSVSPG